MAAFGELDLLWVAEEAQPKESPRMSIADRFIMAYRHLPRAQVADQGAGLESTRQEPGWHLSRAQDVRAACYASGLMGRTFEPVTNIADAPTEAGDDPSPWASEWQVLTPGMREAGGSLGMVMNRLTTGNVGCPFHWHTHEDEIFYVVSGRGVLRYGEQVREIGPGDCISCPAGTQTAHQIANPFAEDLMYLSVGRYDPNEISGYPDTGKIMIRSLQKIGLFESQPYMEGEPSPPRIFALHGER